MQLGNNILKRLRLTGLMLRNNWRIFSLGLKLRRVRSQTTENPRPVIFFNASTRLSGVSQNAAFAFLSSGGVQMAGVPVIHFACHAGMTRCQLGTDPDDHTLSPPCRKCIWQSQVLTSNAQTRWFTFQADSGLENALQNLNTQGLADFEYSGVPLGKLVLPSLRWALRRYHLQEDGPTRVLFREFIVSAWNVVQEFEKMVKKEKPQAIVIFNGIAFPEASARWVAKKFGIRVISHEVAHQPLSAFFSEGVVTAYPVEIPDNFELSSSQNARLDQYLEQRFQGNFSMAGVRFWPEMQELDEEFQIRLKKFKQLVPVFTNVIFDTSQEHANIVFPHMFAWLDQIREIVQANLDTMFVIRAHPDEMRPGKSSRESVRTWVEQNNLVDLPNLVYIDSLEYVSSYALIQQAKFVMVYNSTIGLEAALMGKPVLNGGRARYTNIASVFFPETMEAHRQLADQFLANDQIEIPEIFLRNARRFQYYQLYKTPLPFSDFLEIHPATRGYVLLRAFSPNALHPTHSETMKTITEGILDKGDFLLENDETQDFLQHSVQVKID